MCKTLHFLDHSLVRGRRLREAGRNDEAARIFQQVGLSPKPSLAAEALTCLGELQMERGQEEAARRTLAQAIKRDPLSATGHFLHAQANLAGDDADLGQALDSLRTAVELDPDQAQFHGELGKVEIALGLEEEGFQSLRTAVDLEPADPETLRDLIDALMDAGADDEAARLIRAAIFRNPRHAGFRKLWSDLRFCQTLTDEESALPVVTNQPATRAMILPFPTANINEGGKVGRRRVRLDAPANVAPPHLSPNPAANDLRLA